MQRDTQYSYDSAGRRARERVVVDGLVHQDTHIAYDELGRMSQLSDLRYRTTYRYDGAGNRARISSTYYDHAGVQRSDDLWYTYDAMNRVKVSQGVNSSGTVTIDGVQGIELAYDLKGQRTSAIQYGTKLALTQAWEYSDPYNPQQTFFYSFTSGASTEQYGYDGLGRLLSTDRTLYSTYQPSRAHPRLPAGARRGGDAAGVARGTRPAAGAAVLILIADELACSCASGGQCCARRGRTRPSGSFAR